MRQGLLAGWADVLVVVPGELEGPAAALIGWSSCHLVVNYFRYGWAYSENHIHYHKIVLYMETIKGDPSCNSNYRE